MSAIDFILNLAGVLLWLNWRSRRFDPLKRTSAASLMATLKRAEPDRMKGWLFLVFLMLLLLVRGWLYSQAGIAADWTPKLNLGSVVLAFRTDRASALLYSCLSYLRVMVVFYFWLLTLAVINRDPMETEPIQKLVRQHLGLVARWPRLVQIIAPVLLVASLWVVCHPLLVRVGVVSRVQTLAHLLGQGLLVGMGIFFSLKYVLPLVLLLYLVVSYVFLGSSPLWDFVSLTGRNMLSPLRWIPLRIGKLDLAPLVGAILILLILQVLPVYILPWAEIRFHLNLRLWPL
jgi:uncharacterized protein YggT (Ycf19 family)